jgi:hypothetical protein
MAAQGDLNLLSLSCSWGFRMRSLIVVSSLIAAVPVVAQSLHCAPAGSLRCQLEDLENIGPIRRAVPAERPTLSPQPLAPRAFAITPERRAFLNLLRYLSGTWNGGYDSGYQVMGLIEAGAIGAYQVSPAQYKDSLVVLGAAKEARIDDGSLRPEVQDQVALYLLGKSGVLPALDRPFRNEKELDSALSMTARNFHAIRASRGVKPKRPDQISDFSFYELNLIYLLNLAKRTLDDLAEYSQSDSPIQASLDTHQEAPALRPAPSASNTHSHLTLARPAKPSEPQPLRFDQSLDELVRQGVVSPAERQRIRSGASAAPQQTQAHQQACRSGALSEQECASGVVVRWRGKSDNETPALQSSPDRQAPLLSAFELATSTLKRPNSERQSPNPQVKPLSERETALLRQIRSESSPVWRVYGKCNYDWSGWKRVGNETRVTSADCGESRQWLIGVSCQRLMTNIYSDQFGWQGWTRPAPPDHESRAGEDEMVAALCANLT